MRKLVVLFTALALGLLQGCSSDVGSCVSVVDAGGDAAAGSDALPKVDAPAAPGDSALPEADASEAVDGELLEDVLAELDGGQSDNATPEDAASDSGSD